MAPAPPPPLPRAPATYRPWLGPLLVGLAFGLGYGLTDRLLRLNPGGWVPLGQNFDHRPAPGTTLESLRQRSGDASGSVRGDLDAQAEQADLERQAALERERQKQQEAAMDPGLVESEVADPDLGASTTGTPQARQSERAAPVAPSVSPAPPTAPAARPQSPAVPAPVPPP